MSFIDGSTGTWIEPRTTGEEAVVRRRRRGTVGVLLVAFLVPLALYVVTRHDVALYVDRLSSTVLVTALACQYGAQLLWNGAILLPLRTPLAGLGYWELLMVRSGGLVASYIVPVAGAIGLRFAYLRRRGLGYSETAWATAVSSLLGSFAAAVLAASALAVIWLMTGQISAAVIGITTGVVVLGVSGLLLIVSVPVALQRLPLERMRWLAPLGRARARGRTIAGVVSLAMGRHVLNFATMGLLYESLSPVPAHVVTGGLVYAITSPLRMVAITPGNLGVNEWTVAAVGKLLSFDLTTGLLVGLVFRAVSIAAQVLAAAVAGAWLALGTGASGDPS